MTSVRTLIFVLTALLALPGLAQAKGKKKKSKPSQDEPAMIDAALRISPKGLRFGMSPKKVGRVYEKVIDRDYLKRFQNVSPGIEQQRLEHEVSQKKTLFKRSIIKFENLPTTMDGTPLAGEFTYRNREAMMQIERRGKKRTLFFIRGKLWKVFDIHNLGKGSKWGANFKAAAEKLQKKLGTEGRSRAAAPKKGRKFEEVDWATEEIHIRLINWGKKVAIAYVDRATEKRIDSLRTKKKKNKKRVDDSVRDAMR